MAEWIVSVLNPSIKVQAEPFEIQHEIDLLCDGRTDVGAVVSFTGLCRDEGGRLSALELEHYPGMAEGEIRRIANTAVERWPLTGLTVIHRHGKLEPGAQIVLVIAASAHRQSAFEAASFIMDFLKTQAPFWKKEHRKDGSTGDWVAATNQDREKADQW